GWPGGGPGRRRDLPPAGRDPAGTGTGGRADGAALAARTAGTVGAAVRVPGEPPAGHPGAPSDAPGGDREQLSTAGSRAPTVLRAPVGVPGRLDAGSGEGGLCGAGGAGVSGAVAGLLAADRGGARKIPLAGNAAG